MKDKKNIIIRLKCRNCNKKYGLKPNYKKLHVVELKSIVFCFYMCPRCKYAAVSDGFFKDSNIGKALIKEKKEDGI